MNIHLFSERAEHFVGEMDAIAENHMIAPFPLFGIVDPVQNGVSFEFGLDFGLFPRHGLSGVRVAFVAI